MNSSKITNETPSDRTVHLGKLKINYNKKQKVPESLEEKQARLKRRNEVRREKLKDETDEERKIRRERERIAHSKMRNNETEEKRIKRLERKRIYIANKRMREREEKKMLRIQEQLLITSSEILVESEEKRKLRLKRKRENDRRQMAKQTAERHEARKKYFREYQARRKAGLVKSERDREEIEFRKALDALYKLYEKNSEENVKEEEIDAPTNPIIIKEEEVECAEEKIIEYIDTIRENHFIKMKKKEEDSQEHDDEKDTHNKRRRRKRFEILKQFTKVDKETSIQKKIRIQQYFLYICIGKYGETEAESEIRVRFFKEFKEIMERIRKGESLKDFKPTEIKKRSKKLFKKPILENFDPLADVSPTPRSQSPPPPQLQTQQSDPNRPFQCSNCSRSFPFKSSLIVHEFEHKMLVKCLICLKSISKADYKMHMETHSMKKVCEACSEEFQDNLSYEKHRILVKDLGWKCPKSLIEEPCPICNKLILKIDLEKHQEIHVKENITVIPPDELKTSENSQNSSSSESDEFLDPYQRQVHPAYSNFSFDLKDATEKSIYSQFSEYLMGILKFFRNRGCFCCDLCNENFLTKQNIEKHMMKKHIKKISNEKHICEVCGDILKTKSGLTAHVRKKHYLIRKFHCDLCPKSFSQKFYIEYHMRKVHLKKIVYKCSKCDFQTNTRETIDAHRASHNKKNYVCDICGKSFGTPSQLKDHVKGSHYKIRDCICHICNTAYSTRHILKKHMMRFHDEFTEKFHCLYCSAFVLKETSLARHIKKVHGDVSNLKPLLKRRQRGFRKHCLINTDKKGEG